MGNLPANVSKVALVELREAFIPSETPDSSYLELSIRISDEDLAVRDLSAFLDFIDGVYGRLAREGFQSYARREYGHLKIERIQKGSWELLLREAITSSYSYALIVVLLAVKYLPPAINSLANAYNQVEQGRLARQSRKRIRVEMEQDEKISRLSKSRRLQLAELIGHLHEKEKYRLPKVIRFTQRRLLGMKFRIRRKEE